MRPNMKLIRFVFALLPASLALQLSAQDVQWADRIIGFSSQAGKAAYSARQVLGPPSALPAAGPCGCAWSPARKDTEWGADPDKPEYIKVGFAKPEKARQLLIGENYRPGSVRRVWVYGLQQEEELVYERGPFREPDQDARLFSIALDKSRLRISAVKIELDPESEGSPPQLDGIGLSGSNKTQRISVQASRQFALYGQAADLGPGVNSPYAELLPRLSPDGQTLYFDRKDHPENHGGTFNDDIWLSRLDSAGRWGEAQTALPPLNNAYANYVAGAADDGVLTLYGQYFHLSPPLPGLSITYVKSGEYVFPVNLDIEQFFNASPYTEFYVSADRRVLLMAIEAVDSYGGRDLYLSESQDGQNWSRPRNLGPLLNTGGDEMAPSLSADGQWLFFSSNAHNGYGSQDLYASRRAGPAWTDWAAPENLGPQVNSPAWESHFVADAGQRYGYFARQVDALGNTDLLRIALVEEAAEDLAAEALAASPEAESYPFEGEFLLFGYVRDAQSQRYLAAELQFSMLEDSARRVTRQTVNAQYKLRIDQEVSYAVRVRAPGYTELNTVLQLSASGHTGVRRRDFQLWPEGVQPVEGPGIRLDPGAVFQLRTLQFRVNSAVISRESYPELAALYAALQEDPSARIRVEGHTNNLCDKRYCERLSEARARKVADYLLSKGLERSRITWKGYGKERPLADNNTEEGRRFNQRVEIRVE